MQLAHEITSVPLLPLKSISSQEQKFKKERKRLFTKTSLALTTNPGHRSGSVVTNEYWPLIESGDKIFDFIPSQIEQSIDDIEDAVGKRAGRGVFEYFGSPTAKTIIVAMGTASHLAKGVVRQRIEKGEQVGVINIRLLRPWSAKRFISSIPRSVKNILVLDRVPRNTSNLPPLAADVVSSIYQNDISIPRASKDNPRRYFHSLPSVSSFRYGVGGFPFTGKMLHDLLDNNTNTTTSQISFFDESSKSINPDATSGPLNNYLIGIKNDEVENNSIKQIKKDL
jgi:pyruvate/2-oxoacid:ferredoxin oxidoreductase alpha subunit